MGPIERAQREQYIAAHKRIVTAAARIEERKNLEKWVSSLDPANVILRPPILKVVESPPVAAQIVEPKKAPPPPIFDPHGENVPPRVYDVQRAVCEYFEITMEQILVTGGRRKQFVYARHIALYLAAELCGRPLLDIGRRFRKMDHTSVIHARNRIAKRIKAGDRELFEAVQSIKAAIEQAANPIDVPAFLPVRNHAARA